MLTVSPQSADHVRATADAPANAPRAEVQLPLLAVLGLQTLVLGSLFTGLRGPAALGELSGEGALIGTLMVVVSAVASGVAFDVRALRAALLYLPLGLCVLISYAVNADEIGAAHFLGRAGAEKFVSSLMVLGLYLALFFAFCGLMVVYGVDAVLRAGRWPALLAAGLLAVEMAVEMASWFNAPLRQAWLSVRQLWTFSDSAALYRLVGFAPEPSFAAITALGILGLLATQWSDRGWRGALATPRTRLVLAAIAALLLFQLAANARTFVAGASGAALAAVLVSPLGRRLPATLKAAAIILAPLAIQAFAIWSVYQGAPGAGSVSNITRSVGMLAATDLWRQHPLLGMGLGQYGFHFRSAVPSWGLQSWEISRYFHDSQFNLLGGLPPSFSIFSRLGAELGIVGLLAWILPPAYVIARALKRAPCPLAAIMTCALAAQTWTGLSLDSFRNVFYWLWLAGLLALPGQVLVVSAHKHRAPRALRGFEPAVARQ